MRIPSSGPPDRAVTLCEIILNNLLARTPSRLRLLRKMISCLPTSLVKGSTSGGCHARLSGSHCDPISPKLPAPVSDREQDVLGCGQVHRPDHLLVPVNREEQPT